MLLVIADETPAAACCLLFVVANPWGTSGWVLLFGTKTGRRKPGVCNAVSTPARIANPVGGSSPVPALHNLLAPRELELRAAHGLLGLSTRTGAHHKLIHVSRQAQAAQMYTRTILQDASVVHRPTTGAVSSAQRARGCRKKLLAMHGR